MNRWLARFGLWLYELVEIPGQGDSGRSYARIDEALKWMSVTHFFKNSWWNKDDSQWKTEGFHLLENISISDDNKKRSQR
ncbi:MAG: replication initiator protein A [Planctomycetales bacterium]|nr:replication initiator protein A [Planctomycetales bacterium]